MQTSHTKKFADSPAGAAGVPKLKATRPGRSTLKVIRKNVRKLVCFAKRRQAGEAAEADLEGDPFVHESFLQLERARAPGGAHV